MVFGCESKMSECSGRRTTEVILLCGMRSTRARFICALAFASADWINEYDLSAQREILSADGLTFSDLSHLDETDTAAVLAPRVSSSRLVDIMRSSSESSSHGKRPPLAR